MGKRRRRRRLDLFQYHGHIDSVAIPDYAKLFAKISAYEIKDRIYDSPDRVLVLRECSERSPGIFGLTVYDAEKDKTALLIDPDTLEEDIAGAEADQLIAYKTHAIIDTHKRTVAVEYVKQGAKYFDISTLLTHVASKIVKGNVSLEFAPFAGPDFSDAIDQFVRIREVSLTIVRPNLNWDDHESSLNELIGSSDGQKADLKISAGRNRSLDTDDGIVPTTKKLVQDKHQTLSSAVVKGNVEGEDGEKTVSLKDHQIKEYKSCDTDGNGRVLASDIYRKLEEMSIEIVSPDSEDE